MAYRSALLRTLCELSSHNKLKMNSKPITSSATIAFTLPVSCQICLGKVKQPVVCPNQHVFCGPCMELWLQRNQQCPACRVYITEENPCRKVLGGLNPETTVTENFCQKELRRARMELIYKDYENEIDRLEAELEATKQDNRELRNYIHANKNLKGPPSPVSPVTTEQDRTIISLLNNKLKDAMQLYEKVQKELEKYKQENSVIKGKNTDLERENQTLRLELTNRSPRRFGRLTVATLESKLESSEKQIAKLQKALERSDEYIEDLEKQLQHWQSFKKSGSRHDKPRGHVDMDNDLDFSKTDSNMNDSELPSRISNISEGISEVVSDIRFDDSDASFKPANQRAALSQSSFDLDIPSPISKSSKQFTDTDVTGDSHGLGNDDTFVLPKPSSSKAPGVTLDSCKKKLRFTSADDVNYRETRSTATASQCNDNVKGKVRFSMDTDHSVPNSTDLNVSMTPDLEDCFRIMDEAKRKLEERQQPISLAASGVTSVYTSLTGNITSAPLIVSQQQNLLYPQNTASTSSAAVPVLASSSAYGKLSGPESTTSRSTMPGKPFSMQYSALQNITHGLSNNSDVFATNRHSQASLFSAPGMSQSQPTSHSLRSQMNLSGSGLLSNNASAVHANHIQGLSAGNSVLTNRTQLGPTTTSQLHCHSLGGSTLSQPAQSVHVGLDVPNSGTFKSDTSTVPGFPSFSISQ